MKDPDENSFPGKVYMFASQKFLDLLFFAVYQFGDHHFDANPKKV